MSNKLMYDRVANSIRLGYTLVITMLLLHLSVAFIQESFSLYTLAGISLVKLTLALGFFGESKAVNMFARGYHADQCEATAWKYFQFQTPLMVISFILWAFSTQQ